MPDARDTIDPDAWPAAAEGIAVRAIREALPDLPPSTPTIIARRIMADLVAAGLLAEPPGTNWHVVVKTVPGRDPELMAEIVNGADELRAWLADLRRDPDRDPLATFTGYLLTPAAECREVTD